ncbi:MFS transporter [Lacticaseibacillus baoqingensis]|uniref:MFS transporter n=1 Tax=Lacticaseibacillus baoqingensis TaxID=2486013 RepID=A0ABW4EC32_9LACO|nr:MFS transporter [Lacticaseibacillus baoqingensis]
MLVVAIVALMSFLGVLTETSLNTTFPALMQNFHVSLATVQWVTSGYLLMAALVMLTSAYTKRRFTNRQLFIAAAVLFCIGDLLCASAQVFAQLLLGRLIQAGCVGICTPLMVNIILDVVPRAKLGLYLGIANVIVLIAPALGPTFGGAVTAFASWRMIFWLTLPLALLLLVLGSGQIHQYTQQSRLAFDWGRFFLLAVALITLNLGLTTISSGRWLIVGLWLLVCAVSMTLFLRLSRTSTRFLFSLTVFKHPAFLFSFLPYLSLQFSNVGINFLLPNYVQDVFGASAFIGGLILLPGSVFNGLGQPVYGWMLDHFGGRLPLLLGDGLFTLGVLTMAIFGPALGVGGITGAYLIFAIGRSMAFSNSVAFGLKALAKDLQPDANALYNMGQQAVGGIGTTVLSLLMTGSHHLGWSHAQNIAAGSAWAFWLLVALGGVIFTLYWTLLRRTTQP